MVVFAVFHITNGLELSEKLIKVKKFQYKIKKYLHYCIFIILCWHERAAHTWKKNYTFQYSNSGSENLSSGLKFDLQLQYKLFLTFSYLCSTCKMCTFLWCYQKKRALQSREFSKSQIVENTKCTNRYQSNKATGTFIDN